jgi:PleD family two-component response regulator
VTDSKDLKLLVVEDDLEDEQLLCEALIEIEEKRLWCNWRTATVVQVDQLADALDCLRQDRFDVVLLNLSLPDSPALLNTFLEANACARGTPIVVLADEEDENLANRLLREGAQDVVLKSELECAPLARSLRYAIERQRRSQTPGNSPWVDDLTRTLTRQGFVAIADRYAQLAAGSHIDLFLAVFEVRDLAGKTPDDREARDLVLIEAGEVLREAFQAPALIGRLERYSFGLIVSRLEEHTVEGLLARAAAEIEAISAGCGHPVTVRFSLAELDQNQSVEELLTFTATSILADPRCDMKPAMLAD